MCSITLDVSIQILLEGILLQGFHQLCAANQLFLVSPDGRLTHSADFTPAGPHNGENQFLKLSLLFFSFPPSLLLCLPLSHFSLSVSQVFIISINIRYISYCFCFSGENLPMQIFNFPTHKYKNIVSTLL